MFCKELPLAMMMVDFFQQSPVSHHADPSDQLETAVHLKFEIRRSAPQRLLLAKAVKAHFNSKLI